MMNYYGNSWGGYGLNPLAGVMGGFLAAFLIPIMIWSIFWKGWALWRAAKADSKIWFIILLLVNTVGILEIVYIFLISKQAKKSTRK